MKDIYTRFNIGAPTTILTDKDTALLRAIDSVFPTTNSLICLWHINMNIMKKVRPTLQCKVLEEMIHEDLRDIDVIKAIQRNIHDYWITFLADWYKIVNAKTEETMWEQWRQFKRTYNGPFTESIEYIRTHWMHHDIKRRFLNCFTSQFFHANQTTTSRNEGAHAILKKELKTSLGDLLYVVQRFETVLKSQLQDIKLEKENNQYRVAITLRKQLFSLTN